MVSYNLANSPDRASASETERRFVALIEKLDQQLLSNPPELYSCSFPRRISHLCTTEIQEGITLASGPEAERLQSVYASLKILAIKDGHRLTVQTMQTLLNSQDTDLRPSIRGAITWITNQPEQHSLKDYFIAELLPDFAKFLHYMKKSSSREVFCSDSFVQTILHVQQKFFMIDSLASTPATGLSTIEQQKLKGLLTKSLKCNLVDFLAGLEIEVRYRDYNP